MTRAVVVKAFLEGASIATLAELLGHDVADLEAGLRMGLIEIQTAEAEPPAEKVALPAPPAPEAGASSPRPARNHAAEMKRDPVRRRVAAVNEALDLTGYPAALQDPRAETQRRVYAALSLSPATTMQIQERSNLPNVNVSSALQALRVKRLVIGSETTPVVWRIA